MLLDVVRRFVWREFELYFTLKKNITCGNKLRRYVRPFKGSTDPLKGLSIACSFATNPLLYISLDLAQINLNARNTTLAASKLIVDIEAPLRSVIKSLHGVTLKIKLNIESTMFAGVGSEHSSSFFTTQL